MSNKICAKCFSIDPELILDQQLAPFLFVVVIFHHCHLIEIVMTVRESVMLRVVLFC